MSARIVFTTFGSFGDLHPIMSIAHQLRSRGHRPVIATSEIYRRKIEDDGLEFHAVRPDLAPPPEAQSIAERVMHPVHGPEYLFRRILLPSLRDTYNDLVAVCRDADLLVSYPTTFAMPLVAEKLNKKWVSVNPWVMSIWSAHDLSYSPLMPMFEPYHRASPATVRLGRNLFMPLLNHWMKDVRELRRELQLPPNANPIFEGQYSPHAVLALFSSCFAAPQPDWPANTVVCGYCFYDKRGQVAGLDAQYSDNGLSPELKSFLDKGDAPIVFTLGSAAVHTARDFYERSAQAARLLNKRALLLIGDEANRPPSLPQNTDQIAAFTYAPYSQVFDRACVIVHQGGGGTIGQVLRAGKPSLTVPFGLDQPDHAMRLQRIGAGLFLRRCFYNASRAARKIQMLLDDATYARRAAEIGDQVRAENGAATAADVIENVLRA